MSFFKPKPIAKEWLDHPPMEAGAPEPAILAADGLLIAYRVSDPKPSIANSTGYATPTVASGETWAVVRFESYLQIRHGYPNDEVLSGHPLFHAGLRHYAIQEIVNSPWAPELAKQNAIHPGHAKASWTSYKHWLFAFHDETFEVLTDAKPEVFLEVAPSAALAIAARLQRAAD